MKFPTEKTSEEPAKDHVHVSLPMEVCQSGKDEDQAMAQAKVLQQDSKGESKPRMPWKHWDRRPHELHIDERGG